MSQESAGAETNAAPRQLLVVAFHYPPDNTSTGVLRTLKFTQYLLEDGWRSTVLSVPEKLYRDTDPALATQIPPEITVLRTWAVDLKQTLGVGGSYPGFLTYPDRYWPWLFSAIRRGRRLLRTGRFQAIYTTYPVPTAHVIGWRLKARSGLPWIADFRDPWLEDSMSGLDRRLAAWLEPKIMRHADRVICNTPAMRRMFLERYPSLPPEKFVTITNGYDEPDFVDVVPRQREKFQIIYPGVIDAGTRDPTPLLAGVELALARGWLRREDLVINFLGSGPYGQHPAFRREVERHGLGDVVEVQVPRIPYRQALEQLAGGDLLVALCEPRSHGPGTDAIRRWSWTQVPVKVYEYLRLGRPILALVSAGAIADLFARTGGGVAIPPTDIEAIAAELKRAYAARGARAAGRPPVNPEVARYSRERLTRLLAAELEALVPAPVSG